MGHLITVQNLLVAIGNTPYLGRYDRSPNEFDPFPFSLEPISHKTIAKYALCEMPDANNVDPEEKVHLSDIIKDASELESSIAVHRVGLLYMKIYWLLRETDQELQDTQQEPWLGYPVSILAEMFPGRHVNNIISDDSLFAQAKETDWQAGNMSVIVRTIENRIDAQNAIAVISAQGEGFTGETDAHFDRFVEAYILAKQNTNITRPLATNPWYRADGVSEGKPEFEITSTLAIDFAKLGDLVYGILIIAIVLAIHPNSENDELKRSVIADFCIALMREVLKPLARALPVLTIQDDAAAPQLSLCYTLPVLPDTLTDMHKSLHQQLSSAFFLSADLETRAQIPQLRSAARTVRQFIETRREDVEKA
jgi:hypothetical protein